MKRVILALFLFALCGTATYAQLFSNRLTFGGGIGMQFGDYTMINIAPQIGYNITHKTNIGAGFTYSHYKEKFDDVRYKNDYAGFNVYARYYPLPFLVTMIQPEMTRMWKTVETRGTGVRNTTEKLIGSCLVGAGLRLGSVTAMLQYDLAQNSNSPYGDKIFYSVGYTFSF